MSTDPTPLEGGDGGFETTTVVVGPEPQQSHVVRLLVDHNPFYLLSAICMLAGCLTLTNTLSYSPIKAGQLLVLLFTLNAYELLMVAMALFLIRRRGVRRDGLILLLIETLFLVDMAFLNAELYSVDVRLGTMVNAALLVLGGTKLYAIFRVLRFPLNDGLFALTLAQLVVLFGTPGVFANVALGHDGALPVGVMYATWWVAGLLPVLYVGIVRPRDLISQRTGDALRDVLSKALLVAPAASLLVHLFTANWVYKLTFYPANFGPVLLGLAIAIGHHNARVETLVRRVRAQLLLPVLAMVVSAGAPWALLFEVPGPDWSPLRLAFVGAVLVYLDGLWVHRHAYFAYATGACVLVAGFGATASEIRSNGTALYNWLYATIYNLAPRTPKQWGVLSVVASFLLLAIGFAISLLKPAPAPVPVAVEKIAGGPGTGV